MRTLLRRCWWGTLCLVHIAPLISATRGLFGGVDPSSHALSASLVWLAFAFFALKFMDVRWLRWRAGRSSVLAFVVACGVAHHDVSAAKSGALGGALMAEAPAALAGSLLWELAGRARRAFPQLISTLYSGLHGTLRLRLVACDALLIALAPSLRRQSFAAIAIPRAPPLAH